MHDEEIRERAPREQDEWLEADGLGGFAMGTATGVRTRRYHGLLHVAATPPTGRTMLVNGLEVEVDAGAGPLALSCQRYAPDVVHPDGHRRLAEFEHEPWPRWTWHLGDGLEVQHTVLARHGSPLVLCGWRLAGPRPSGPVRLRVRPLLSGRDTHATHHENGAFRFEPEREGALLRWRPYDGVPAVVALSNARYHHDPCWYRSFLYAEERRRGLDALEDLAAPGLFELDLAHGEAWLLFGAEGGALPPHGLRASDSAEIVGRALLAAERERRERFADPLERAADQYLVKRGAGRSLVAGYPWFTDWGRDTFIALRGLCLATGELDAAREILLEWSGAVSEGMLPNRFVDRGEAPEYNSVDASLWFVVAVHELREATKAARAPLTTSEDARLAEAVQRILEGYARGTRFGIRAHEDGLLAQGEPGWQLTWMDAKVGDWVVTPRVGKPVEVQALWINALAIGAGRDARWKPLLARAERSFAERFWDEERGMLHDVVDEDHVAGRVDASLRPNQLFALGGLPLALVPRERALRALELVERELWTPLGPRSLAPSDPRWVGRYEGGPRERDGAYHQGTVWPWLAGPFVEAWVRARGSSAAAKREARERFLPPLVAHLREAGLGHVSEIADGDAPFTPRGCPFQAWSLGELLRLERVVLAPKARPRPSTRTRSRAR